jgi:hypothetical protein
MANIGSIRHIKRPPPAKVRFNFVQGQIVRELKPVGEEHVRERESIVADFETSIQFGHRVSATEKQITLSIVVENSEQQLEDSDWTVGELWRALDKKGTKPHTIRPKTLGPGFGGRLSFQANYQPHTRPIGRSGGPGRATGPTVYARQVNHPGFAPRKFSEVIGRKLKHPFEKAIHRGVALGWRKVK